MINNFVSVIKKSILSKDEIEEEFLEQAIKEGYINREDVENDIKENDNFLNEDIEENIEEDIENIFLSSEDLRACEHLAIERELRNDFINNSEDLISEDIKENIKESIEVSACENKTIREGFINDTDTKANIKTTSKDKKTKEHLKDELDLNKMIGLRVKNLRRANNLTQKQLANYLNVSSIYITMLENGKRNFTNELLYKLSRALNCSVIELNNKEYTKHSFDLPCFDFEGVTSSKIEDVLVDSNLTLNNRISFNKTCFSFECERGLYIVDRITSKQLSTKQGDFLIFDTIENLNDLKELKELQNKEDLENLYKEEDLLYNLKDTIFLLLNHNKEVYIGFLRALYKGNYGIFSNDKCLYLIEDLKEIQGYLTHTILKV